MKTEAEMGGMWPQPREAWSPKKLEEVGRSLPWSPRWELGPAETLISDFWLQNWKRMTVFRLPSVWPCVIAAQETPVRSLRTALCASVSLAPE